MRNLIKWMWIPICFTIVIAGIIALDDIILAKVLIVSLIIILIIKILKDIYEAKN